MAKTRVTRKDFLEDRQGATFADVANDPEQHFDVVLEFFSDANRQRRMEESEIHHDRAPLAGVVRELESHPVIEEYFASQPPPRAKRLRQAIDACVERHVAGGVGVVEPVPVDAADRVGQPRS